MNRVSPTGDANVCSEESGALDRSHTATDNVFGTSNATSKEALESVSATGAFDGSNGRMEEERT